MLALIFAPLLVHAELAPLTDQEWKRYLDSTPYSQPAWPRPQSPSDTKAAQLLQRAAEFHQQGEMDKTVQLLKTVLQRQASEYHGEAFAALAKALADQGKHDLADRAMSKATKIYNEKLAAWSLF